MLREQLRKDIFELKRNGKYNSFQIGLLIALWPFYFIPTIFGIKHQRAKTKLINRIIDGCEKLLNTNSKLTKNELMSEVKERFPDNESF